MLLRRESPRFPYTTLFRSERHAEPEVAAAVLAAAGVMRSIGAETVEVEPPQFDTLSAHCIVVMQSEASAQHARWMRRGLQIGRATSELQSQFHLVCRLLLE